MLVITTGHQGPVRKARFTGTEKHLEIATEEGWRSQTSRAGTEREQITSDQGKKLRVVGEPDYHQRCEDNLAMTQLHALITYILHAP